MVLSVVVLSRDQGYPTYIYFLVYISAPHNCHSQNYKRAIYRKAPRHFSVYTLSPTKHGAAYMFLSRTHCAHRYTGRHYTHRIHISAVELDADGANQSNYEISRRWRDILLFRETLETQYRRLALSRQTGPHDVLPEMTMTDTVFWTGRKTAEKRNKELQVLLDYVFNSDASALLVELRGMRPIADFFSIWRQDYDHAQKLNRAILESVPLL